MVISLSIVLSLYNDDTLKEKRRSKVTKEKKRRREEEKERKGGREEERKRERGEEEKKRRREVRQTSVCELKTSVLVNYHRIKIYEATLARKIQIWYILCTRTKALLTLFSVFFSYTIKVTTEAAQGTKTKMEARSNDDIDTTRVVARFVSTRNSCRIFRCFSNCSRFYGAKRVLSSQTSV